MKKVFWKEEGCDTTTIYFDFEKDFPHLGCEWICDAGGIAFTDCDLEVDDETDNIIKSKIDSLYHKDCDEEDYEYVQGLVKEWGL